MRWRLSEIIMKFFIDTEFHEYKRAGVDTIELISIALVAEDGREYYAVSSEYNIRDAWVNVWLRKNVLRAIVTEDTKPLAEILRDITLFVGADKPEFYGYYADYDWVVFCWLFGRMIDLPDGYPMYCRDLKQTLDERAVTNPNFLSVEEIKEHPNYPKAAIEHHALADARWIRDLYGFLTTI